jgi:HEPN domain-containing protein
MADLMDAIQYAEEWFDFSKMDLGSAEHLLTMYPVPDEVICYLSQQSAEKALKGFIALHNDTPPKTHNLVDLCMLCEQYDTASKSVLRQLEYLNQFSVMPRYPHEMSINDEDAKRAIQYAKIVYELIVTHRELPGGAP